jgi:hypothetical protein
MLLELLAWFVIAGPIDPPPLKTFPIDLQIAIEIVAIRLEIMGPNEVTTTTCLGTLRWRYRDLAGTPNLWEHKRFPTYEVAKEAVGFNRKYFKYLEGRRDVRFHEYWQYDAAMGACNDIYIIWDALADAANEDWPVPDRRHALAKLREHLGEEDWRAGKMPFAVPIFSLKFAD